MPPLVLDSAEARAVPYADGKAGAMPEEGDEVMPAFRFSTIAALGRRHLFARPVLLLLYLLVCLLTQTIIPQQAVVYFATITNHFQGRAGEGATVGENTKGDDQELTTVSTAAASPVVRQSQDNGLAASYGLWIVFTFGLVLATFGQSYLVTLIDGKVSNSLQADVFASLIRQSPRFFHTNEPNRLAMIVNQFCNLCATTLRQLLLDPLLQAVSVVIIGYTIYKGLAELVVKQQTHGGHVWTILGVNGIWLLFLVIVLFALLSPWVVAAMGNRLQRDVGASQQNSLALATLIGGALRAPEEIQGMAAEKLFERKHHRFLNDALRLRMAQNITMEKINSFSGLPGSIVLAAFLGLAIYSESAKIGGEPGTIVKVALLTPILMGAAQRLSSFALTVSMAWPHISLIDSVLKRKSEVIERADAKCFDKIKPSLEARNLTFSYEPGRIPNVFNGISFSVPEGKTTGLIARKGQGKSTFFLLALRFYEPQSGDVLVGDMPASSFTLESLRHHVVLMHQSPVFFFDTVRENFLIADPNANDEEIIRLCELTGIWEILAKHYGELPLDAQFAAGASLSGGEKKLFALTRCLLRKPTILLLDEPTTGIDPIEKFDLIDKMRAALTGKTVVVVDHDIIWQCRFSDEFLVLDHGQIVQRGDAGTLLSEPGLFRELHREYETAPPHGDSTQAVRFPSF